MWQGWRFLVGRAIRSLPKLPWRATTGIKHGFDPLPHFQFLVTSVSSPGLAAPQDTRQGLGGTRQGWAKAGFSSRHHQAQHSQAVPRLSQAAATLG